MAGGPINPDREQQRRDNIVSRRQSGLEPRPEDLEGLEEAEPARAADRERQQTDDVNEDRNEDGNEDER